MPFIAIAIALSLFLGGSAYAATTPQGHAVIESMTSTFANVKVDILGENSDASATTSVNIF